MITDCGRFWRRVNKRNILILFCSIPVTAIIPVLSLLIPMLVLYYACDTFIVFKNCGDKQDDSLRFILTMPFSRTQIFETYVKGLAATAASYFCAQCLLRALLAAYKFPFVFYWVNKIHSGYEFIVYLAIFAIYLLAVSLAQIYLINNYTSMKKSVCMTVLIFIVAPSFFVWEFLNNILMFFTGFFKTKIGVGYDFKNIVKIGITEKTAEIASIIIYIAIIMTLSWWLISLIHRERIKFTKAVQKC